MSVPLLVLAMWLHDREPHVLAHDTEPIRTSGRIGHVVSNSSFAIRVDSVVVARSLSGGSLPTDPRETTDGVFLIVKFRAMGQKKPYSMQNPRLESGSYTYDTTGRTIEGGDFFGDSFPPMMWKAGQVCFEIPKNRLAGARIVVGEGLVLSQLSAESAVDLGIGKAKAADLIAHAAEGYNLKDSGR